MSKNVSMGSPGKLPRRNTLDQASSPYLRQHQDNPVWWHEWSTPVLEAAEATETPLFVSVGYATCHWCHVMAAEAFSDETVAQALNERFVCIKVDREERPDIDQFLMQFLLATRGQGGWPLNAFLSPDRKPMLALTYMPVEPRGGMPGFVDILNRVVEFYREHRGDLPEFNLWELRREAAGDGGEDGESAPAHRAPDVSALQHLLDNVVRRADQQSGGFGSSAKFPPHNTLLFLLFGVEVYRHAGAARVARHTLDRMAQRGLHDHLQGGFFRYCVDRDWTIPHFEKMLYDQAMLLWVYAVAAEVFSEDRYREVALGVVRALEETFVLPSGALASAHDADTDHQEGATYLWTLEELNEFLNDPQRVFEMPEGGNFEGMYHLVRRDPGPVDEHTRAQLDLMLARRNQRSQPARDDKVVTAWNALAATALIVAGRTLGERRLIEWAGRLYEALLRENSFLESDGARRWIRSSLAGNQSTVEFLEDYAAVLLLQTHLLEHAADPEDQARREEEIRETRDRVLRFHTPDGWTTSWNDDLAPVPADTFDSPSPSPVSLAEMSLQRAALQLGEVRDAPALQPELSGDFANLAAALAIGEWYFLEGPEPPDRRRVPHNVLYVPSARQTWCFRGVCRPGAGPEIWNPSP